MGLFKELRIPVNPEYDWDQDPHSQLEYVNPVQLNNRVIQLANATLVVAERIFKLQRQLGLAKLQLTDAEQALEGLEQDLLQRHPPPVPATKNLKLLQHHVLSAAQTEDGGSAYRALMGTVREAKREVVRLEHDLSAHRAVSASLGDMAQQIQTHLSFVKAEAKQSGRYP